MFLWIRIHVRNPDPESGSRGKKMKNKFTPWCIFVIFVTLRHEIVQNSSMFYFKLGVEKLGTTLSANVLLWIQILIGSGFNDFMDQDPD
jgi:hypothetical protein